jgi:hypothetical protein
MKRHSTHFPFSHPSLHSSYGGNSVENDAPFQLTRSTQYDVVFPGSLHIGVIVCT